MIDRSCVPSVRRLAIAVFAIITLNQASVQAHFLFVRISPLGEGGRRAEVFFSEKAEAGDPRFIAKLTGTKLWVQPKPGAFEELPVKPGIDRLRAPLPASGSIAVIGVCDYGVRAQANKPSFLLRYYPKAVAGSPNDVNAFKPKPEVPFEIVPRFEGDSATFTVLVDGKPASGIKLTTVDIDLTNHTFVTNDAGQASWKPGKGEFSVYAERVVKTPGVRDGASYVEIREFTTVAFRYPLERDDADSEAVAEFEKAIASRAQWTKFPGFSAKISGVIEGRDFNGTVEVPADGKPKLSLDDDVHAGWIADQLGSIVLHRKAEATSDRPVLRFADDDATHPLGRLLEFEGGRFASSYRIKDGHITTVNRDMGSSSLTIVNLDTAKNAEGKELPKTYLVQVWDAKSGALTRSESVSDAWKRVGAFDLPESHTVVTSNNQGVIVREFLLSEIKLLSGK